MPKQLLFVCSGNTCRSPMAETLLRAALPPQTEWTVASAGTSATPGSPASEFSQAAMAELGLSLKRHRSQAVTAKLVEGSTVVVAMTQRHLEKLLAIAPQSRDRLYLLRSFDPHAPKGADVMDPYCGTLEEYRACRDVIQQAIPGLVTFLKGQSV